MGISERERVERSEQSGERKARAVSAGNCLRRERQRKQVSGSLCFNAGCERARLVALGFGQLLVADAGVKRDTWDRGYVEDVRDLGLGKFVRPSLVAARTQLGSRIADQTSLASRIPVAVLTPGSCSLNRGEHRSS